MGEDKQNTQITNNTLNSEPLYIVKFNHPEESLKILKFNNIKYIYEDNEFLFNHSSLNELNMLNIEHTIIGNYYYKNIVASQYQNLVFKEPNNLNYIENYIYSYNPDDEFIPDPWAPDRFCSSFGVSIVRLNTSSYAGKIVTNIKIRTLIVHPCVSELWVSLGCFDFWDFNWNSSCYGSEDEFLWAGYGSCNDNGLDDDPESDQDIYLNWREIDCYNGEIIPNEYIECHLKVCDQAFGNNGYIDYFEIKIYYADESCSITVDDPNGGESWDEGSTHTIRWHSSGTSGNVSVWYGTDRFNEWNLLTGSTPDDGSWSWTLPYVDSDKTRCRVMIMDVNENTCWDGSDNDFTIKNIPNCSITVDDPNGGEVWDEGSTHAIRWHSVSTSGNVRIRYSTNSGSNWTILTNSTPDDGRWDWNLPDVTSDKTNCRVRVEDAANSACYDISNSDFTIQSSCNITVDDPNGGESWDEGSTHAIRWQSVNTSGNVRIRYSTNSGSNWTILTNSTPDDGRWDWTLPDVSSDQTHCRIRVEDAANSACFDISNSDFTIKDNPLFNISGTVKYYEGDTPVPNVELNLMPNNIITLTDADGNYGFNDLQGGIDYTVTPSKVSGTDQNSLTITSQDAYQTSQFTFGIITPNQYQTLTADVDGDGKILMWDASLILRHSIGQQLPDSITIGDWWFDPLERNYPSLNSNQTNQDYTAVVIGDVNGSWSATNLLSQTSSNIIANIEVVQIDSNTISLKVRLSEPVELTSIDLKLRYNPAELNYVGLKRNLSSDVFNIVENNTQGLLALGGFAIKKHKLEMYSPIFEIVFNRNNSSNEQSEIQINQLLVNDFPQPKKKIAFVKEFSEKNLSEIFQLFQNYPNPFNPETTIRYTLGWREPKLTIINIYDVTGKLIKRLTNNYQKAGEFEVRWDGLNEDGVEVPSGVYICSISSGDKLQNIKMLKIK
ncbi:T9SS type A sorting domain-containing protein [candidate division KSB1 bacterium]|nr:T9SS type A sorting domain-containing protein [candidate division KSB1 bacterium]